MTSPDTLPRTTCKVFISWSGEPSKSIAMALREWLPVFLHACDPWMSDVDIAAGETWNDEIERALSDAAFGIICLTPGNREKPWVLYEAGALTGKFKRRTSPYLFGLTTEDVTPPLSKLNMVQANKADTLKLLKSINDVGPKVSESTLRATFEGCWPQFYAVIEKLADGTPIVPNDQRDTRDLVVEVLEIARSIDRRIHSTTPPTVAIGTILKAAERIGMQMGPARAARLAVALRADAETGGSPFRDNSD